MSINEENNLIGYDPLAWMASESQPNEVQIDIDELQNNNCAEQPLAENDVFDLDNMTEDLLIDETVDKSSLGDIEIHLTNAPEFNDQSDTVMTTDIVSDFDDSELVSEETGGSQIDLDATLSIQNVVKLHEKLKLSLAMHDHIEINASDVVSIDTATLQLLVSLKKDALKLQKEVVIIYPSPRFIESAHLLGLLAVLDVHDL